MGAYIDQVGPAYFNGTDAILKNPNTGATDDLIIELASATADIVMKTDGNDRITIDADGGINLNDLSGATELTLDGSKAKFFNDIYAEENVYISGDDKKLLVSDEGEIYSDGADLFIENVSSGSTSGMIIQTASANASIQIKPNQMPGIEISPLAGGFNAITLYLPVTAEKDITLEESAIIKEKASAYGGIAGYGQLWVKDDAPNKLYFTDDAGTDFDLTDSGAGDFADGGEAGGANRTLGNTDNYDLGFLTNNLTRLTIAANGNVSCTGSVTATGGFEAANGKGIGSVGESDVITFDGVGDVTVNNETLFVENITISDGKRIDLGSIGASYLDHDNATDYITLNSTDKLILQAENENAVEINAVLGAIRNQISGVDKLVITTSAITGAVDIITVEDMKIGDGKFIGSTSDPDSASIAADGVWTFTQNITMADGKSIGNGPTITFDDIDNHFEFTGGDVGIGTGDIPLPLRVAVPYAKTDVGDRAFAFFGSNEAIASNPFGLYCTVKGAAAIADRVVRLQTVDYGLASNGTISLQSGGGGVGIGTLSPDGILDIEDGDGDANVYIKGFEASNVNLFLYADQGDNNADLGRIQMDTSGSLSLQTFATGSYTGGILIASSGDVGIGTTSPDAKLEITSATANDGLLITGPDNPRIHLKSNTTAADPSGTIRFSESNDTEGAEIHYDANGSGEEGLVFDTIESGSATTRMAVTTGGVGIVTTAPATELHIRKNKDGTTEVRTANDDTIHDILHTEYSLYEGGSERAHFGYNNASNYCDIDADFNLLIGVDGATAFDMDATTITVNTKMLHQNVVFSGYDSAGGTSITTSGVAVPLGAETVKDAQYTHSTVTNNSRAAVNDTGIYDVSYSASWTYSGDRTGVYAWLRKNGTTPIVPSRSYGYGRGVDNIDECTVATTPPPISLTADDYLELMLTRFDSNANNPDTIAGESWVTMRRIRQ